jgi:CBS domain-containing protein
VATAETAGEIMSTCPVTVRADATVPEAARLIERFEATCLPVVDENGNLVGMVDPRALLRGVLGPDEIRAEIARATPVGGPGPVPR